MCSATCRPNCHYTWIGPNSYRNENSYLQFDAIYRNQSGLYFCEARNSFGSMESNNITIAVNCEYAALKGINANSHCY